MRTGLLRPQSMEARLWLLCNMTTCAAQSSDLICATSPLHFCVLQCCEGCMCYRAVPGPGTEDWVAATSEYGGPFVAALQRGDVCGTQFHPEKSGAAGLDLLKTFLEGRAAEPVGEAETPGDACTRLKTWVAWHTLQA